MFDNWRIGCRQCDSDNIDITNKAFDQNVTPQLTLAYTCNCCGHKGKVFAYCELDSIE